MKSFDRNYLNCILIVIITGANLIFSTPTIPEYQPFNPEADADFIRNFLTDKNDDAKEFRKISSTRRIEQRQIIVEKYNQKYNANLRKDLNNKASGNYLALLDDLYKPEMEIHAHDLYQSFKNKLNKLGNTGNTNREAIEILVTCAEKQEKKEALMTLYEKSYGESLLNKIDDQYDDDFENVLEEILKRKRAPSTAQVDPDAAKTTAESINSHADDLDDNRGELDSALLELPIDQAKLVMENLEAISKMSNHDFFKKYIGGQAAIVYSHLASYARGIPKYFQLRLKEALEGWGTSERTLNRITVTRADWDMVEIKNLFKEDTNGETLGTWIQNDTSDNYRKLLMNLIGEPIE